MMAMRALPSSIHDLYLTRDEKEEKKRNINSVKVVSISLLRIFPLAKLHATHPDSVRPLI